MQIYIINSLFPSPVQDGVLPNCQIICDAEPCKNGGTCHEHFAEQYSTCECEHTSFLGEFCSEEKGADFSGESTLQRKFELGTSTARVDYVRLQLAFSSFDLRRANRIMLLMQTDSERSYYLLLAITSDGYLQLEEDLDNGQTIGARIDRNFLNSARHSVYYVRNGTQATLFIDREQVPLSDFAARVLTTGGDAGSNRVQIGGINSTDSRFAVFKSYSGCLSSECRKFYSALPLITFRSHQLTRPSLFTVPYNALLETSVSVVIFISVQPSGTIYSLNSKDIFF